MQIMTALLIGRDESLLCAMPSMLTRAGFVVDVISSSRAIASSKFIRNYDYVPSYQCLIPVIESRIKKETYDWIIVTDDPILLEIVNSDLSLEDKLKILPVQSAKDFRHIYSKISLSEIFSAGGIKTPPFAIVRNTKEAADVANQFGYPVLLKEDASAGGEGVFQCNNFSELQKIDFAGDALLIQPKIPGREFDMSALYLKGELIYFSCSRFEKVCRNAFGPSSVRTYYPLAQVEKSVFDEVAHIGKVLGANGFVNLCCIEQADGDRFYFEADMRPNAWVEMPRFFGEDPAERIRKWFASQEKMQFPVSPSSNQSAPIVIPYFLRLKRYELLINRYGVWDFIPREDYRLLLRLCINKMMLPSVKSCFLKVLKKTLSRKHWKRLRDFKYALFKQFHQRTAYLAQ